MNKGYRAINPNQAVNLGGGGRRQLSPEQEEAVNKFIARKARNQLAMTFAQSMVNGRDGFDCAGVSNLAFDLANAFMSKSDELDKEDPIDAEKLAGLNLNF